MMSINQLSLTFSRVVLGIVILAHGVQKLLGWFGGYGFEGTMEFFTQSIGLPYSIAFLIIIAETLGMLCLILGLFSRVIAIAVILLMLGASFTVHAQFGFYMNWFGAAKGEGFEFHLAIIAIASVIALQGGGAFALDNVLPRAFSRFISIKP